MIVYVEVKLLVPDAKTEDDANLYAKNYIANLIGAPDPRGWVKEINSISWRDFNVA